MLVRCTSVPFDLAMRHNKRVREWASEGVSERASKQVSE